MSLELPQGRFSAHVQQANAAVLAARRQQPPVVPVGGPVRRLPEPGEGLDGLLRVPPVDVDLGGKKEGVTLFFFPVRDQPKKERGEASDRPLTLEEAVTA